jgi:hypothetical protein
LKGSSRASPNTTNRGRSDPLATSSTIQKRLTSNPGPDSGPPEGPESGPLEPSRRTTIRTVANDPAAIDARTLATQWRGGHEALTSSRVRAGFGVDLANPQSSSVTKTGRSPLPCRSPCTAPRGVTHAAEFLAPAQDTVVRRVRRRAIPDHHRHTPGRNRGGAFCPRCSPQKRPQPVDQKIANIEEG